MILRRVAVLGLLGAVVWIICPDARAASPSWTPEADAAAYGKSNISLIRAIAIAERKTGGRAIHADFQVQRGKGVFEVETLTNKALTVVTIDADADKLIGSTATGTIDAKTEDQRKAIDATAAAKVNLEGAAAQGDATGDWTVDAGVTDLAGAFAYRVDVLKDGKTRTMMIDPVSGKVLPSAGGK
jgi:uncharacterized membrane protein YkoI